MMKVLNIDSTSFTKEVLDSGLPVIVDFYADWCGPCKLIGPMVEEFANQYEGKIKFCKLNVDKAQDIAAQYGVMSIPTLMAFKAKERVDQLVGAVPREQLQEYINKQV